MAKLNGDTVKAVYHKAFEDSFIENYEEWRTAIEDANASIGSIGKEQRKRYKKYTYDEFCCLAKSVVENELAKVDWNSMIKSEDALRKANKNGQYIEELPVRVGENFSKMETDILHACFRLAIKNRVGDPIYAIYRKEIERVDEVA